MFRCRWTPWARRGSRSSFFSGLEIRGDEEDREAVCIISKSAFRSAISKSRISVHLLAFGPNKSTDSVSLSCCMEMILSLTSNAREFDSPSVRTQDCICNRFFLLGNLLSIVDDYSWTRWFLRNNWESRSIVYTITDRVCFKFLDIHLCFA